MGIYSYFFPTDNYYSLKAPKCVNCSEILLITKLDIANMTIDYKCDNCFKVDKKNILFYNFLKEGNISKDVSDTNFKCETHDKPYAYFCETCFRHNCEDCFEKTKYPKHKFFDLTENKVEQYKIDELDSRIINEYKILNKLLNVKLEFEKYKNKYPLEELYINKNFKRILIINIKEKINMIEFKKLIVDNYKNYPNNFLFLQNVNNLYQLNNKINKDELCEDLINSSIKGLKEYEKKYLFKYMETKTLKFNIRNREKIYLYIDNYLQNYNNQLPIIYIENTDLIIFIDFNILCINIKTGELISYLTNLDLNYDQYDKYPYCSLTNNKFLIFSKEIIDKYEFTENTIKKINIHFDNHSFDKIQYIYKIFNEHYLIIDNYIFYEKEVNHYVQILEIKDVFDLIQVNYLRKSNEEYFIGKNKSYKCFLIKFCLDENNNSINYSTEQLNLDFYFCYYRFINDTNILFDCGYHCRDQLNKFVIYDLKNRNIICKIKGKDYDDTLNNVLPKIKNVSKAIKIKYYPKSDLPYGYREVYPLKIKNDESQYFIGKNYESDIYEFKIFKYDI